MRCSFWSNFQRLLADYPTEKLIEPISDFHNTVKRFQALKDAIKQDKVGRAKTVQPEIDFAIKREKAAGALIDLLQSGKYHIG